MRKLADLIARDAEQLAELEVRDGGKLVREMVGQMKALPDYYFYYAGLADKLQGEVVPVDKPNFFVYTRHEPVGVVGAITPWNSPLLLLTWKLAAGLAAGCTFVIKPKRSHADFDTGVRKAVRRGRLSSRRGQRRDRLAPTGAALVAPRRRQDRIHRIDGNGLASSARPRSRT